MWVPTVRNVLVILVSKRFSMVPPRRVLPGVVSQLSHVRFPSSAEVSVPRGGFPQAILSVKAHELELELELDGQALSPVVLEGAAGPGAHTLSFTAQNY